VTAQGASKLYDVWIYSLQDAGTEGLLPPDDHDGAPEVDATAGQVAARVLEGELALVATQVAWA